MDLSYRIKEMQEIINRWQERAEKAEAELAALAAQKPFMYGIMTANGDAYFEELCVSSDPAWLEDEIWEWNNGLADNEPKNRVVPLFTRAAPAGVVVPDCFLQLHKEIGARHFGRMPKEVQEAFDACNAVIEANKVGG